MHLNAVAIVVLILCAPGLVRGQAWLPPRGEGSVSLSYLDMVTSDHLLSSGQPLDRGPARFSTITAGVLYAITDRVAVNAEVPYVASKFTLKPGLAPNEHDLVSRIDDGRYHETWQDFHGGVKYNVLREPVMFTPFFEVVIPTHHYQTFGHSAPGKYLREYHVGASIGRLLNPILPRVYFDLRYTYAFVEKLQDLNLDRNNADLEVGYFLRPSFALRAIGSVQKTLGGVEAPVPADSPYFLNHDRLERGHYSRIGGGATFSVRRNIDLYFLVISTLSGKNIQAFTAPVIGISWNFQTRNSQDNIPKGGARGQDVAQGKAGSPQ